VYHLTLGSSNGRRDVAAARAGARLGASDESRVIGYRLITIMKTFRMWLGTIGLLVGVAVLPAEAVPIAVTQELTLTEVRPWGTFTTAPLAANQWSLNPFPFSDASQITSIGFWFDSTDADYVDGIGPTGGSTWTAISVLTDSLQRFDIASVNHAGPSVVLAAAQGAFFTTVRSLLLDGVMSVQLGAYEAFPSFTRGLTLGGLSTLRVEVRGDVPAPQPTAVPEPTTLVLIGAGLLGLAGRARRKNPNN
jgi:hypothetical protein